MTRDPARIDPILARLRAAWRQRPDLRLGQLIVGSLRRPPIGDYPTDDGWMADWMLCLFNAECAEFGASGAPIEWPEVTPTVAELLALVDETHRVIQRFDEIARSRIIGSFAGVIVESWADDADLESGAPLRWQGLSLTVADLTQPATLVEVPRGR